jgi:hypothetical protein
MMMMMMSLLLVHSSWMLAVPHRTVLLLLQAHLKSRKAV